MQPGYPVSGLCQLYKVVVLLCSIVDNIDIFRFSTCSRLKYLLQSPESLLESRLQLEQCDVVP